MDDQFEIPVHYKNKDLLLPAKLEAWSYGHRIIVEIDKQKVIFEPDEQRNYRAIVHFIEKDVDVELLGAIVLSIQKLFS